MPPVARTGKTKVIRLVVESELFRLFREAYSADRIMGNDNRSSADQRKRR